MQLRSVELGIIVLFCAEPYVSMPFSVVVSQVINTGVKVWSRNSDGEEFGCAFRLAQEVTRASTLDLITCHPHTLILQGSKNYFLQIHKQCLIN